MLLSSGKTTIWTNVLDALWFAARKPDITQNDPSARLRKIINHMRAAWDYGLGGRAVAGETLPSMTRRPRAGTLERKVCVEICFISSTG